MNLRRTDQFVEEQSAGPNWRCQFEGEPTQGIPVTLGGPIIRLRGVRLNRR